MRQDDCKGISLFQFISSFHVYTMPKYGTIFLLDPYTNAFKGRAKVVPATPLKLSLAAKYRFFGGVQFHGGGSVEE